MNNTVFAEQWPKHYQMAIIQFYIISKYLDKGINSLDQNYYCYCHNYCQSYFVVVIIAIIKHNRYRYSYG